MYLARQLVEQGHDVTLLTRGKSPVTQQIPDDTDDSFAKYEAAVKHIACDRKDADAMKEKLSGAGFQGASLWSCRAYSTSSCCGRPPHVSAACHFARLLDGFATFLTAPLRAAVIYDMNGREADEAQIMLDAVPNIDQYIFCSSAGVYLKSDQMPHREEDAVDPKSRHKARILALVDLTYAQAFATGNMKC